MGKKRRNENPTAESFTAGPYEVRREGRTIRLSSRLTAEEAADQRKRIAEVLPQGKASIQALVDSLLEMIAQVDGLALLAHLALEHCFGLDGADVENRKVRQHYVEYVQSLVLTMSPLPAGHLEPERYEEIGQKLGTLYAELPWYFGAQTATTSGTSNEFQLRMQAMARFLAVRGDAYADHMIDHIRSVYSQDDHFLSQNIGYTTEQLLNAVAEIDRQVLRRINDQGPLVAMTKIAEKAVTYLTENGWDGSDSHRDQLLEALRSSREAMDFDDWGNASTKELFVLEPNSTLPENFLRRLSAAPGANTAFGSFLKSPSWPTNNSVVYERPLIECNGRYYCFSPPLLHRQFDSILESWIRASSGTHFENTFQKKRSDLLEATALKYISRLLPGAKIFSNVFIHIVEDGEPKRPEIDAIVLYDQTLLIVEAKSGGLPIAARRGGFESIRSAIRDQVDAGYSQCERTRRFIRETPKPVFENADGTEALVLDRSKIRDVFSIVPTLEPLGAVALQLGVLRDLGFLAGTNWPWCLYINDMRVISELIDSPAEFLLYLERRTSLNEGSKYSLFDELDCLMWFLSEGLYFEGDDNAELDFVVLGGRTENLDAYYDSLSSGESTAAKPKFNAFEPLKELVRRIESCNQRGASRLAVALLALAADAQRELVDLIARESTKVAETGAPDAFSLSFREKGGGITVWIGTELTMADMARLDELCALRKYEAQRNEWFLLALIGSEAGKERVKIKTYFAEWGPDSVMDSKLKERDTQRRSAIQPVGRNAQCPCGSGRKYKACHGRE